MSLLTKQSVRDPFHYISCFWQMTSETSHHLIRTSLHQVSLKEMVCLSSQLLVKYSLFKHMVFKGAIPKPSTVTSHSPSQSPISVRMQKSGKRADAVIEFTG